jgi:hypothetical protein
MAQPYWRALPTIAPGFALATFIRTVSGQTLTTNVQTTCAPGLVGLLRAFWRHADGKRMHNMASTTLLVSAQHHHQIEVVHRRPALSRAHLGHG